MRHADLYPGCPILYQAHYFSELCGPFDSDFRGHLPTRPKKKLDSWAFEKVLQVYTAGTFVI